MIVMWPYVRLLLIVGMVVGLSALAPWGFSWMGGSEEGALLEVFFLIATLGFLSFVVHYITEGTVFPSFVVAIFFGMAAKPLFAPVLNEPGILGILVGFGATLILFGGGLEIPFKQFRRLLAPILTLSFVGLLVTAFLLSQAILWLGGIMGIAIPVMVAVLLGAVLASTDPAAIIPVLSKLRFRRRAAKDIVISESAITDVVGALLTITFLGIVHLGVEVPHSVWEAYGTLANSSTLWMLGQQLLFGVVFGVLGYLLLEGLVMVKRKHGRETEADAAFFMGIPILVFVGSIAAGGSGYLAAFIAGLLLMLTEHLHETERFFQQIIDGFLKPTIFVILGSLVDPVALWHYAPVGIGVALLFMLVIRPLAVGISLGIFPLLPNKEGLQWKDLLFIACIRETGAIPAVLLVTIVSTGLPGLEAVVPIGMWVILFTLIIAPPLTPRLATALAVAEPIADGRALVLDVHGGEPVVVIASRGYSFGRRLPEVLEWASRHHVRKVVLLCCPEGRYTLDIALEITEKALDIVQYKNDTLVKEGRKAIEFVPLLRQGFLQENIEDIIETHGELISALFVGKRVLDYRLTQIKNLNVPLYFVE